MELIRKILKKVHGTEASVNVAFTGNTLTVWYGEKRLVISETPDSGIYIFTLSACSSGWNTFTDVSFGISSVIL